MRNGLIIILLLLGGSLDAQVEKGIRVGVNSFNHSSRFSPSQTGYGFTGGIFMGKTLTKHWGYQIEANFIDQPASGSVFRYHFIGLPLLTKYSIKKLDIKSGVEFKYLIGKKYPSNYWTPYMGTSPYEAIRKFDLALNLGLHYKFTTKLGVDIRYGFGLIPPYPIMNPQTGTYTNQSEGRNESLYITLDYVIFR